MIYFVGIDPNSDHANFFWHISNGSGFMGWQIFGEIWGKRQKIPKQHFRNALSGDSFTFPRIFLLMLSLGLKKEKNKKNLVEYFWRGHLAARKKSKICDFGHFWRPNSPNAKGSPQKFFYDVIVHRPESAKMLFDPWNTFGAAVYSILKVQFTRKGHFEKNS